ncbi:MAG: hypothetical protein Q9187_003101 [Circinaria calcarea]
MASVTNYFVCTLGQAAAINPENLQDFSTVGEFLERQSKEVPTDPALGFPIPPGSHKSRDKWDFTVLTFRDLCSGSASYARLLRNVLAGEGKTTDSNAKRTVALLCPSSPVFLLAWLGLMRLGYAVLLIADAASSSDLALQPLLLPLDASSDVDIFKDLLRAEFPSTTVKPAWSVSEQDVAYLHHTSGTSTGLPKPIAQTHRAAVGVLPCLTNGKDCASFTTTPLYHGGIADCFRAWTSGALIWLFPGKGIPITADNVLRSLETAKKATLQQHAPTVKYFSSVPYVLQMLAAETKGLDLLRDMDIVGVGGAALPQEAGDELVKEGVNLISRFGSAECGFLMSSHRNYATDTEWQYLRSGHGSGALGFEKRDDGLAELIVLPNWPHMAKRNRDDGSFATADLFAPHPKIPAAWKYHSRADSQLTLITGKKFDPAPLEAAIATSSLLSDVLIFGNGQQYPGALLFLSEFGTQMESSELLDQIWLRVEKMNAESQVHTRLSKSMLVIMPADTPGLEKSSKGTILRNAAEKRYQEQINAAYAKESFPGNDEKEGRLRPIISDNDVPQFVLQTIKNVTSKVDSIPEDADLFSEGVDSVACMQIRAILQKNVIRRDIPVLPLNVVLSKYLIDLRKGRGTESEDEVQLMKNLVTEYSHFPTAIGEQSHDSLGETKGSPIKGEVVVLTGATGALGAHILDQLRSVASVSSIICLVRAADPAAAYTRVNKSLLQRQKAGLAFSDPKVSCVITKLGKPNLGLPSDAYSRLKREVTVIIHAAWAVNFSMHLRSFVKDHIAGLRNLIGLSLQSSHSTTPRFIFCSSTASVLGPATQLPIQETVSKNPNTASTLGYSRSKWVAESICEQANLHSGLQGRISILRIGQLCGDTQSGVWNVTEAWPLMLSTVKITGSLPALKDEKLAWLPVDIAAQAVLQIAFSATVASDRKIQVYHLVNEDRTVTWMDLLSWIRALDPNPFKVVPAREWVTQLEKATGESARHPARKLLGLWKGAYCAEDSDAAPSSEKKAEVVFEMENTKKVAPVLRDVRLISEEHFRKIWQWMEREMLGGNRKVSGEDVEKAGVA